MEILKGGDIRSGSGALGGVVKYRTREPASFLNAEGDDSYLALKGGYRSASDQFSKTLTLANRHADLEQLLRYEPGVNVTKDSRFGIGSVNIRGLDGDRVKLLIDGVVV